MDEIFANGRWYNATQAVATMRAAGAKMSRTTFFRKVRDGAVKWTLRRNFPGKWYRGRDLNRFYLATY